MANPFTGANSITSAQTSSGIGLDPTARVTMVCLDLSTLAASTGAGTTDITIQATVDVMTSTWSGTSSASVIWENISTTHYSSASYPATAILSISSPVAGLRLYSSAWAGGISTVTMKVLQEILA